MKLDVLLLNSDLALVIQRDGEGEPIEMANSSPMFIIFLGKIQYIEAISNKSICFFYTSSNK